MTRRPDLPDDRLLDTLVEHAREVAVACGRLIRDERPHDLGVGTKSTVTDVVTIMDTRSEELARQEMRRRRPDDGSFGEEGLDAPGTSGITWVVDPIDGTVNYLYDLPGYAVSVAAVVGDPRVEGAWYPVAGAVYSPVLDELFHARRGGGAWLTQGRRAPVPLTGRQAVGLGQALVATGFGYDADDRARQGAVVAQVLPRVRDIRRFGTASVDVCHVAAGRVDAYYEKNLHAWDIAAAWVVAEEAGLAVRGLDRPRPTRAMTLVGRPELLDDLEAVLRAAVRVPDDS